MTNKEIRKEAWHIVFKRKWIWRLILITFTFGVLSNVVSHSISFAYKSMDIMTITDYRMANMRYNMSPEEYERPEVPDASEWPRILGATFFFLFIMLIINGIKSFGMARAELKAARDTGLPQQTGWSKGIFEGFKYPFSLMWQMLVLIIKLSLWFILFIIPGFIAAFYRYRFLWFVKSDHPDWTTSQCFKEAKRLMKGRKMRAFKLDCSYWLAALAPVLPLLIASTLLAFSGVEWIDTPTPSATSIVLVMASVLSMFAFFLCIVVVGIYWAVGSAVFYRETLKEDQGGSPKLFVATHNQHKIREISQIIPGVEIVADDPEGVEENAPDFIGNARIKVCAIADRHKGAWCMADDSGLEVQSLGGEPGVHSARYAGDSSDTAANNALLLKNLDGVANRTANFTCAIALIAPDGSELTAIGKVFGRIADAPSGGGGFGYDPLFIPDGYNCSFAELSADEKNAISHRGKALEKVRDLILT